MTIFRYKAKLFFIFCNLTLIPVSHCCCSMSVPRARRGLSSWILDIYYLFEVRYIEYRYALYSTVIITENYNQFYHQPTLAQCTQNRLEASQHIRNLRNFTNISNFHIFTNILHLQIFTNILRLQSCDSLTI